MNTARILCEEGEKKGEREGKRGRGERRREEERGNEEGEESRKVPHFFVTGNNNYHCGDVCMNLNLFGRFGQPALVRGGLQLFIFSSTSSAHEQLSVTLTVTLTLPDITITIPLFLLHSVITHWGSDD